MKATKLWCAPLSILALSISLCLPALAVRRTAAATGQVAITLDIQVANPKGQDPATYHIVQAFMKQNPTITVNLIGEPTDTHSQKMQLAAQAGTLPDMFWVLPAPALQLQQAGNLLDLTNIFSARGLSSRFAPNIINAFRDKGHQYGIPQQLLVTGLWYNRALFTKYGLQPPSSAPTATTFADLEKDVRVFKQHGIITIAQGAKDPFSVWAFLTMLARFGYFQKIAALKSHHASYNNPDFLHLYQDIDALRTLGAFPPNITTNDYFQSVQMFLDGKAAMVDAGAWETARMQSSPIANSVGFWWGPTFANGVGNQRVSMMVPTAPLVVSAAIKNDAAKYQAVAKFIDFYTSKQAAQIMIDNGLPPIIKGVRVVASHKNPVFASVLAQMNAPGWTSAVNQPDLVVSTQIGSAMYDSIYGVMDGIYTPVQALNKVDAAFQQSH